MGRDLFPRYPKLTAAAGEILGYRVEELCLENPGGRLHQTRWTQPALYVVSALSYRSRLDDGGPPPDYLAGHSLGEYNALLAAGVFSFETGLRMVKRRGELMGSASGGRMAAVLGCAEDEVAAVLERNRIFALDVASYNAPSQVVLSGPANALARAEAAFTATGAKFELLNVSAAFHSRYMEPFVETFGEALREAELSPPRIPVISNVTARPHAPDGVAELLRRQLCEPVRWTQGVDYLLRLGVEEFEEVGPGRVLTKLIHLQRERTARSSGGGGAGRITPAGSRNRRPEPGWSPEDLGAASFRLDWGLRRAYVAGAMGFGISSPELVVRMGRAGYLGFFGAHGLESPEVEAGIHTIRKGLEGSGSFGVNLVSDPDRPEAEMELVDLCLRHDVRRLEAAGFVTASPALVRFRLKGLERASEGRLRTRHKLLVKVSRPEAARAFLDPPPERIVAALVARGLVTEEEAGLARLVPMADDLCVEADCGWRTELGAAAVLLPTMIRLRDETCRRHGYGVDVRVGSSGGIGTPEAAAAAFVLGSDFVLTGSVNQCSVEAAQSDVVKDLLEASGVQDTEYAPAADLFELGAEVQVLKKGVRYPARASRLYELWRSHGSWEEIDVAVRHKIEKDFLRRRFEEVWQDLRCGGRGTSAEEIARAEGDDHHRLGLVFRWYCHQATQWALAGDRDQRRNFQVACGPALGAFNQSVHGTALEAWRRRHVDGVADFIMEGAAEVLNRHARPARGRVG